MARCSLPCCGSLHEMANHLHWLRIFCMERVTTNAVRHIAVNSYNDLPHLKWTPGSPTGTACQLLLVIVGWVMRGLQYVVCLGSQICFTDVLAVHMDLKTFWHRQMNMGIYRKRRLIWYMYAHTKPHRLRRDDCIMCCRMNWMGWCCTTQQCLEHNKKGCLQHLAHLSDTPYVRKYHKYISWNCRIFSYL